MNFKKIGQKYIQVMNLDFKGGDLMNLNKIENFLKVSVANITGILFLLGLLFINIAMYSAFNINIGLVVTGATLIVISLIINNEANQERRQ